MQTFVMNSEDDLAPVVEAVLMELCNRQNLNGATVLALYGDLGAGKTTFVQHLARALGITEQVTSPTFVVMKRYELPDLSKAATPLPYTDLYHLDAYRIESNDEMRPLHFDELIANAQALVAIEWAGHIVDLLPKGTLHLRLTSAGFERTATLSTS